MVRHKFKLVGNAVHHLIDDELRAMVPEEHYQQYAELWPDIDPYALEGGGELEHRTIDEDDTDT